MTNHLFLTNMLDSLNPQQQKAVQYVNGPQLILAGAGSGKTRVLAYKVAYLIKEKHVSPENILMVTFTNKAANEMKSRIQKLLTNNLRLTTHNLQPPYAGTFHSFSAKILRQHGYLIGVAPNFLIYDEADQKDAIKEALLKLDLSLKQYYPNAILSFISQAKNELLAPLEYLGVARGRFQEVVAQVYLEYQKILTNNRALDFDDLLMATVQLLKEQKSLLNKFQRQYKYVLVDEYQDTNHAQYTLTKLISEQAINLCVVGDASQSIYSWRGANVENILNFHKDYPKVKVFYLEQNYRSTQNILDGAFHVISQNSLHPVLKLWTRNSQGQKIFLYSARNEHEEAAFIISEISKNSYSLSHCAVLYRTNAQSRIIEEVFLHEGLPYVLVGGVRFYERKEIKDVLSYLRLIANSHDSVSQNRLLKLGKNRFAKFTQLIKSLNSDLTTLELLDLVTSKTGYLDIFDKKDPEDAARLENIKELRSVAESYPDLGSFLENVALVEMEYSSTKNARADSKNAVTLMTLHSAKGLEFETVFMVGMEEGLFPHSRSLMDSSELAEERRLCYVGMTRAKKNLYLTYASRRLYFGMKTSNMVSRFISDIPEDLIQNINQ